MKHTDISQRNESWQVTEGRDRFTETSQVSERVTDSTERSGVSQTYHKEERQSNITGITGECSVGKVTRFSIFLNLENLFCQICDYTE